MDGHVYKTLELTGTSNSSIEDAVKTAIAIASRSVRQMAWFQITETRGAIRENKVHEWQVTLKVGFKIES